MTTEHRDDPGATPSAEARAENIIADLMRLANNHDGTIRPILNAVELIEQQERDMRAQAEMKREALRELAALQERVAAVCTRCKSLTTHWCTCAKQSRSERRSRDHRAP